MDNDVIKCVIFYDNVRVKNTFKRFEYVLRSKPDKLDIVGHVNGFASNLYNSNIIDLIDKDQQFRLYSMHNETDKYNFTNTIQSKEQFCEILVKYFKENVQIVYFNICNQVSTA